MRLLEREPQLSQLDALLKQAASGKGRLVFLGGEAGGGKTSLIERFAKTARPHSPVAIVSCDGFGLPGPFESLFDVAEALDLFQAGSLESPKWAFVTDPGNPFIRYHQSRWIDVPFKSRIAQGGNHGIQIRSRNGLVRSTTRREFVGE